MENNYMAAEPATSARVNNGIKERALAAYKHKLRQDIYEVEGVLNGLLADKIKTGKTDLMYFESCRKHRLHLVGMLDRIEVLERTKQLDGDIFAEIQIRYYKSAISQIVQETLPEYVSSIRKAAAYTPGKKNSKALERAYLKKEHCREIIKDCNARMLALQDKKEREVIKSRLCEKIVVSGGECANNWFKAMDSEIKRQAQQMVANFAAPINEM